MVDYEKLYKETLAKAREIHRNEDEKRFDIEWLFPELKESEDEKIRKELIAWLKNSEGQTLPIDRYHAALAWLEKQGNCCAKWQKNTPDNKPAINHSVLMKTVDDIAEGEWDGKYWHQYRWSTHIYDSNILYWIELHDLDEQCVQKPTSDIKYKVSVDGSLSIVNDKPFDYEHATIIQKDFAPINDTDEEIAEAIKNTSVLDMVEPKQEWSEEDEKMTKELIEGFLSSSSVSPYRLTHTSKEIADWLKSLKSKLQR